MLNDIPNDILMIIINHVCSKPSDYLLIKGVNKNINSIINKLDRVYEGDGTCYNDDLNNICKKDTSIMAFKWLFKNRIKLSLDNINELIINDRYDVFNYGLEYHHFLKVIFNRFYIYVDPQNDIFSLIQTMNPLIFAGIHNRLKIIQILLNGVKDIDNPYKQIIPSLLDISIKYNHKNILSYLITKYYDLLSNSIQTKLNMIIFRISNCEDILFYLMVNKKIRLEEKHFPGIATMGYNDFFIKYYPTNSPRYYDILKSSIETNNITIFNYILQKNKKTTKSGYISGLFIKNIDFSVEFLHNLINKHIHIIKLNTPLIRICIQCNVENDYILKLIEMDFMFTKEDMKVVLENGNIKLLEYLCHKFNIFNE